jgi:hypothetical protein
MQGQRAMVGRIAGMERARHGYGGINASVVTD